MGCCMASKAVFPPAGYEKIQQDTNPLIEECCPGSIIRKNYRGGGNYVLHGKNGFAGSVAVTDQRILVYGVTSQQSHVPFDDDRIRGLEFRVRKVKSESILCIKFDLEPFHPDGSMKGELEDRLKTPRAQEIVDRVEAGIARANP